MTRSLSAVALLAAACTGVGARLTAPVDDHEAYRRTRIATTLEGRLAASHRYLDEHPSGRFRGDVREWFMDAEVDYFDAAKDSLPRLRLYLATLPDGPHAEAARERIVALEALRDTRARRERQLVEFARDIEAELDRAELQRRELLLTYARWVARLAAIRIWGAPTSALPGAFLAEWRLAKPPARCSDGSCKKLLTHEYAIPDARRLDRRTAIWDVTLLLERGGVAAAWLSGPELFSRLGEAVSVSPVRARDAQARAEAIAHAVQITRTAIEPHLPEAQCAREATSPDVLVRECDGVRLVVSAAMNPDDEDRIDVVPSVLTPGPHDGGTGDPLRPDPGPDDLPD